MECPRVDVTVAWYLLDDVTLPHRLRQHARLTGETVSLVAFLVFPMSSVSQPLNTLLIGGSEWGVPRA